MNGPIVAIDGTAASGKSTTARKVAEHFHYRYIDTGAMYRAVTLKALRRGVDVTDLEALTALVKETDVDVQERSGSVRVYLDKVDVTEQIRSPEVTRNVSAVSEVKAVREALVEKQRALGSSGSVVVEGRDIGTVVFPRAAVKVFMDADVRERARRRGCEYEEQGIRSEATDVENAIQERDRWDSSRVHSPLRKAADAQIIDTTRLTVEEQVAVIIEKVERFLKKTEGAMST